ncbi:hypothetical protein T01_3901 [Trichinella spiralis]|uniref:Uncharacterized protein n=1 Tax=Trichinella spiralis TaxID=6334 RepID=A0A0V1AZF8_TRISP|nr:hypothetical protein T01_3901 [Trichinella spiralis]
MTVIVKIQYWIVFILKLKLAISTMNSWTSATGKRPFSSTIRSCTPTMKGPLFSCKALWNR